MESLITDTSTHPVIGVFPNNWEFSRFGREFERSNERNGDSPIGPMLSVSEYRGIEVRTNFRDGQLPSEDVSHYRVVRPGQLVANLMWLDHGGLGVSHFAGYVSPAYMAFNISERVAPAFAHHVLRSSVYVDSYKRLGRGVRPNSQMVDSVDLRQLPFPLPPFETQQRIADYLDRETAEIDAAVADLDRYVELLEKRKRATGLAILEQARHEPTTLMVHLGSLGLFVSGSGFPHRYQGVEGEEFPFYKVGSLSTADEDGIIQDSRHSVSREVAEELGAKIIPAGSVLMAKIGEAMRLCRFVVTATDCCIDNNMMAIIPRQNNITSDYLRLALELVTVDVLVNPGPVPSLNVQGLRMFSIPLPSMGVQKRMTIEWNKETARLDSLIADSTKLRDLLLKRRSVLITEVVTGRKQV